MSGYRLILKEKGTRIYPKKGYLEFIRNQKSFVIAYRHLEAVYLYEKLRVPLNLLVKITGYVPVYLIDSNGYIKATLCNGSRDESI